MTYRLARFTEPGTYRNMSVIMYYARSGKYAPATRKGLLLVANCTTRWYNDVSACFPCAWKMSEVYNRKSMKVGNIV